MNSILLSLLNFMANFLRCHLSFSLRNCTYFPTVNKFIYFHVSFPKPKSVRKYWTSFYWKILVKYSRHKKQTSSLFYPESDFLYVFVTLPNPHPMLSTTIKTLKQSPLHKHSIVNICLKWVTNMSWKWFSTQFIRCLLTHKQQVVSNFCLHRKAGQG